MSVASVFAGMLHQPQNQTQNLTLEPIMHSQHHMSLAPAQVCVPSGLAYRGGVR
jgi:hypothetical protein